MSKNKYPRKRMYTQTKWLPFVKNASDDELKKLIENEGFSSYNIIEKFSVNEGKLNMFFVEDKIYDWICKYYTNIMVVIPCNCSTNIKTYVQPKSNIDKSNITVLNRERNSNNDIFPLIILFKDKKDAAKFKLNLT